MREEWGVAGPQAGGEHTVKETGSEPGGVVVWQRYHAKGKSGKKKGEERRNLI